ncbi:MAG: hypothetical protein II189_09550, partial [Lachnospiraceae bacterium]|nr:hypothetical protein [Lachnospiraceae bacterium]
VYEHFSSIPKVAESFTYHDLRVSVAKMEHNRIRRVAVKLPLDKADSEEKGGDEA